MLILYILKIFNYFFINIKEKIHKIRLFLLHSINFLKLNINY